MIGEQVGLDSFHIHFHSLALFRGDICMLAVQITALYVNLIIV